MSREVALGAARRRRVLAGQDTVTPRAPVTVTLDGRREQLRPGRDRFARQHPLVRARPDLFRPSDAKDTRTASELRAMVARSGRAGRPRRAPWRLDTGRGPSWRL